MTFARDGKKRMLKTTPESKPWGFQIYNTIEDRECEERSEIDGTTSACMSAQLLKSLIGPWWQEDDDD